MDGAGALVIWPPIPYRYDTIDKTLTRVPSAPDWQRVRQGRALIDELEGKDLTASQDQKLGDAEGLIANPLPGTAPIG